MVIEPSRITIPGGKAGYLMTSEGKAGIFGTVRPEGLQFTDPRDLLAALRQHLLDNLDTVRSSGPMEGGGVKVNVRGPVVGPTGKSSGIKTVWGIDPDRTIRLITGMKAK